ncbi:MAG: hypothetical protein ACI4D0_01905 [Lachnospira sp.]
MRTDYDFELQKAYKKANIFLYLFLSLLGIGIVSIASFYIINVIFEYNMCVTSDNRGDYLAIMGTHCSVVFLTTSLMAMLSEKNRYIYWVEMVTKILISSKYMSFLALATYALSTIIGSFVGLLFGIGPIIIGSFLFGIISVTVLFSRMVSIYYQNEKNKKKIEKYLYEQIEKNNYEKYLIRIKEITYIKAEKREFIDVYENLNLLESCLLKVWEKKPRESQLIFQPVGFCEELYVDMMSDLSIRFPQEMQDYIENHSIKDDTIKKLGYLVYPILLNSYLRNHRIDMFDRTLCRWSRITEQQFDVIEYIIKIADSHSVTIADYYSKVYNPFNHEIKLIDNADLYIDVLQRLYFENPEIYEYILQYRGNRNAILHAYFDLDNVSDFPLDVLSIIAEGAETKTEQYLFISFIETLLDDEIVRHQRGTNTERENIEKNPLMLKVIRAFTNRNEVDLKFAIGKIMESILNVDSAVYLNAGKNLSYYYNFEQWALDYGMIVVKKEMEREDYEHHNSKHVNSIDILQKCLEKLNYKGRRVSRNEDGTDNIDFVFKKSRFRNEQLAIYVYSDKGDEIALLTKEFDYHNTEQFNFETNTILIDGYSCPQNIIIYMLENGFIQTIGRGSQVDGKSFPIAFVNEDWLKLIEEIEE